MVKNDCLKTEYKGRCCCSCRWHKKDFSSPTTDGNSIMHQRGWACTVPIHDGIFSGWAEHGLCEEHEFKGTEE